MIPTEKINSTHMYHLSGKWLYPDTRKWDPERNTREFIEAKPSWRDEDHWIKARASYKNGEREIMIESLYHKNPWWPYGGKW
jgi:hypothetical protein